LIPAVLTVLALVLPAAGEAAVPGSISGTVTAKVGDAALEGVEVCAEAVASEGGGFGCATTDALGEYEIAGLAAGQYKVEFSARSIGYVSQFYAGRRSWGEADLVTVSAGLRTPGIDAELEESASISGTVTAAQTHLPVAGVEVCAFTTDEAEFGCDETDGAGFYAIKGLAAGQYEVFFSTAEIEAELVSQFLPYPLSLTAGQDRTGIDVALDPGAQIAGTVRLAATGAPLAGVEVCVTEAAEAWALGCLKTPPSGRYRFLRLWAGPFKVVFSPEAGELEDGAEMGLAPDAYPTQWWNGQPTFAAATQVNLFAPGMTIEGVDGSLGPGPVAAPVAPGTSSPPATTIVKPKPAPTPAPAPLKCKRGFVKKKLKGKQRCVKRARPKHHRKHHPKPSKHATRSR
jgi:hypothetical protein